MSEQPRLSGAVFLSYASQDAEAAALICEALRAAGVEVWLDKSELRGGDAWDAQIKKHIHDCAIFIPVISAQTNARSEGYFRREWKQATRRLQDMADDVAFLVPVVIDQTREADARVPEEFLSAQWTWLPGGETPPAFAQRVRQLLGGDSAPVHTAQSAEFPKIEPSARKEHSAQPRRWFPGGRGKYRVRNIGLGLIALLLILGSGAFWYYQGARDAPAAKPAVATAPPMAAAAPNDKSIAVLPFADMSAEKDQEHMSDGIAEEILNLLAQVSDLKVIARTSSFAFKDEKMEISEIAKKLNVAHVLEGSVRTSGDKLRITAQLVRTADSTHLWSERYDRPMDNIFAVQDEIASAIVQALRIRLKGGTLNRRAGGTENVEAYELYLRAVSAIDQNNKASLDAAEDYLNQATKLDPQFGLAWYQLAVVAESKVNTGDLTTIEGYERFERFTKHALQVSPDMADAHAALANLYVSRDFDWTAGRAELQRALTIDPNSKRAQLTAAIDSATLGDYENAERQIRAAMQRDPLDLALNDNLAGLYYSSHRYPEAEVLVREKIARQPDSEWTRSFLAKILLLQGKVEAAEAEWKKELNEGARIAVLPLILHAAGRKAEVDAAMNKLIEYHADEYAVGIAKAYAYTGDYDRAMKWYERAYLQKDSTLYGIVDDPLNAGLATDRRFKEFLRNRLKLPV